MPWVATAWEGAAQGVQNVPVSAKSAVQGSFRVHFASHATVWNDLITAPAHIVHSKKGNRTSRFFAKQLWLLVRDRDERMSPFLDQNTCRISHTFQKKISKLFCEVIE